MLGEWVDFEYTNPVTGETRDWSLPGRGTYAISDILRQIGIQGEITEVTLKRTDDMGGSARTLYLNDEKTALVSEEAFKDTFELTITVDGVKYVFIVTDAAAESYDVGNYITIADISGGSSTTVGDKWYITDPNGSYNIHLRFEEKGAGGQFPNLNNSDGEKLILTYDLPEGIEVLQNQSGTMTFTHETWGETCNIQWTLTTDGHLTMEIDNTTVVSNGHTAYDIFKDVTNGKIDFNFTGKWDGKTQKIHFSNTVEREVTTAPPPAGELTLSKSANFDEGTKRIKYTIIAKAVNGNVNSATLTDTLSGAGITMDPDTFNSHLYYELDADSYGPPSFNGTNTSYTFPITGLKQDKSVIIEYYADIDYALLDTDKDGKVTINANNTVTDGKTSAPNNFTSEKTYTGVDKTAGTASDLIQVGDKYYREIEWTLKVNESQLGDMSNQVIRDAITTTNPPTELAGDSFTLTTIKDGVTNTRPVPWSSVTHDLTSFEYHCDQDAGKTAYIITYKTRVEVTNLEDEATVKNKVTTQYGQKETEGKVGPVEEYDVQKDYTGLNELGNATWTIKLTIPSKGLSKAEVQEQAPNYNAGGKYYPEKVVSYKVRGLQGDEHCVENIWNNDTGFSLVFYKDKTQENGNYIHPGLNGSGTPGVDRYVYIDVETSLNSDWLNDSSVSSIHTNTARFNSKTDTAEKAFPKQEIRKSVQQADWPKITTYNGTKYYVLRYLLEIQGVDQVPVTINDSMDVEGVIYWPDNSLTGCDPTTFLWDNLDVYGRDDHTDYNSGKAMMTQNGNGATFTINSLLKKADDSYYAIYKVRYYVLVPVDGVQTRAAAADDLIGSATNTATWNGHTITSTFEDNYDGLDKQLLNEGQLGNTNRIANFRIRVNGKGATVNGGVPYKLEDNFSDSLAVDYSSIQINPSENVLSYEITGNTITMWIKDEVPVEITYSAKVMGEGQVTISNTVTTDWDSEEYSTKKEFSAESSASGSSLLLHLMKVDNDNAKVRFGGVKFVLYSDDPVAMSELPVDEAERTFTTDANGMLDIKRDAEHPFDIYFDTEYKLKEVPSTVPEGYEIGFIPSFYIDSNNEVNWTNHHYYNGYTMQVKNTRKKGNLDVVKTVESEEDADKTTREYNFNITLYKDDAKTQVATDVTGTFGDAVITEGTGTFKIVGQNTAHITGIPENLVYVVQEITDIDMAVTYDGVAKESESGKIVYNELKTVTVTNTKVNLDALNVVKSWEPEPDAEALSGLSVQVSLFRRAKNTTGAAEAVPGAATLSLNSAGSWRNAWDELTLDKDAYDYYVLETTTPANTGYEASYYQDNAQLTETAKNASGTDVYKIDVNVKPIVVNISNRKSELTIHKTVVGIDNISEADKAKITFQVKDENDQFVSVKVGNETKTTFTYADFNDGTFTIADGLANGKTYTVVETNGITGKIWVSKVDATEKTPENNQVSGEVTITDYQGEVHFENTYIDTTEIQVEKKWSGDVKTGEATMVLYQSNISPTDEFSVVFKANIDPDHRPVNSAYIKIKKDGVEVATLNNENEWMETVTGLKRGQAYDFTYEVDGQKVTNLDRTSDEGIEESSTIDLTPTFVEAQKYTYTFTVDGADTSTKGFISVTCNGETAELNAQNGWSHVFNGLVEEDEIAYSATTDGKFITGVTMDPNDATTVDSNETITLTPTFAPMTMNVPLRVTWEGEPDAGTEVTVTFTNGSDTRTYTLTSSDSWEGDVALPRVDDAGDPLVWTVSATATSPESNATVTVASETVSDTDGDGIATSALINGLVQRDMNLIFVNNGVNVGNIYKATMNNGTISYTSSDAIGQESNHEGLKVKDGNTEYYYFINFWNGDKATMSTNVYYIYTYEVSEIKIIHSEGDEATEESVGSTQNTEYNGETTNYYVKWAKGTDGKWKITNTEKEKTEATAVKAWLNADGTDTPPSGASVTFELIADGVKTGKTVTLNGKADVAADPAGAQELIATAGNTDTAYESAAWTAKWTDLPKYQSDGTTEIKYTIQEVTSSIPSGYEADYGKDDQNQPKTAADNGATITNKQQSASLKIIKVDADGMTKLLEGAKFEIRKIDPDNVTLSYLDSTATLPTTNGTDHKTGADGEATFTGLSAGYYEVVEAEIPAGYVQTGDGVFYIKVENGTVSLATRTITEDGEGVKHVSWNVNSGDAKLVFTAAVGEDPATAQVGNDAGTALPNTGGIGTTLFTALGGLVTATAGAILTMKTWRRRKQHA